MVLIAASNDLQVLRIGIAAGRSVGNAVIRNRSKRRLRASVHAILKEIEPGWDIVLIARQPIGAAEYDQIREALYSLFKRARLIRVGNGG